jgi:hypothetical protein
MRCNHCTKREATTDQLVFGINFGPLCQQCLSAISFGLLKAANIDDSIFIDVVEDTAAQLLMDVQTHIVGVAARNPSTADYREIARRLSSNPPGTSIFGPRAA